MLKRAARNWQRGGDRNDSMWVVERVVVARTSGFKHDHLSRLRQHARLADRDIGTHRLRGRVNGFDDQIAGFFVAASEAEESGRRRDGLLMDQLAIEIASNPVAIREINLDIVPSIGLNRAGHVAAEAVLVDLDRMLTIAPATYVPPV